MRDYFALEIKTKYKKFHTQRLQSKILRSTVDANTH